MIFISDSAGNITCSLPENVYQGSNRANEIVLLAPFPKTAIVTVGFRLPNGALTTPDIADASDEYRAKVMNDLPTGIQDKDGNAYNVWAFTLNRPVTSLGGNLRVQFYIYTGTDGEGQAIATSPATLPVINGVPYINPSATAPADIWNKVVALIAAAQSALDANFVSLYDESGLSLAEATPGKTYKLDNNARFSNASHVSFHVFNPYTVEREISLEYPDDASGLLRQNVVYNASVIEDGGVTVLVIPAQSVASFDLEFDSNKTDKYPNGMPHLYGVCANYGTGGGGTEIPVVSFSNPSGTFSTSEMKQIADNDAVLLEYSPGTKKTFFQKTEISTAGYFMFSTSDLKAFYEVTVSPSGEYQLIATFWEDLYVAQTESSGQNFVYGRTHENKETIYTVDPVNSGASIAMRTENGGLFVSDSDGDEMAVNQRQLNKAVGAVNGDVSTLRSQLSTVKNIADTAEENAQQALTDAAAAQETANLAENAAQNAFEQAQAAQTVSESAVKKVSATAGSMQAYVSDNSNGTGAKEDTVEVAVASAASTIAQRDRWGRLYVADAVANGEAVNLGQADGRYLKQTGGKVTGNVEVTGDLNVGGNLNYAGEATEIRAEKVTVKDHLIELGKDNPVPLVTPSGMDCKYNGTQYSALVWDGNGYAYVGDVVFDANGNIDVANSDLHPLALRALDTALEQDSLLIWDAKTKTIADSGIKVADITVLQNSVEKAQNTANAAQTTADSAQTTAESAVQTQTPAVGTTGAYVVDNEGSGTLPRNYILPVSPDIPKGNDKGSIVCRNVNGIFEAEDGTSGKEVVNYTQLSEVSDIAHGANEDAANALNAAEEAKIAADNAQTSASAAQTTANNAVVKTTNLYSVYGTDGDGKQTNFVYNTDATPNTIVMRDASGKVRVADGTTGNDAVNCSQLATVSSVANSASSTASTALSIAQNAQTGASTAKDAADTAQATADAKQDKLTFDSSPTIGSNNPVTSNGVAVANGQIQDAFGKKLDILTVPSGVAVGVYASDADGMQSLIEAGSNLKDSDKSTIVRRDDNGRFEVEDPQNAQDAVPKHYVDNFEINLKNLIAEARKEAYFGNNETGYRWIELTLMLWCGSAAGKILIQLSDAANVTSLSYSNLITEDGLIQIPRKPNSEVPLVVSVSATLPTYFTDMRIIWVELETGVQLYYYHINDINTRGKIVGSWDSNPYLESDIIVYRGEE